MPTIFSHAAVPLALKLSARRGAISGRLMAAAVVAAILPDADVITFRFGIPYEHWLGHRGFTHSLFFAGLIGLTGVAMANHLRATPRVAFAVLFVATASHGILDAATNGGLPIAFFSPFDDRRYFLPWRPIEVSPLSMARFLSGRGRGIVASELLWVWLPCLSAALAVRLARRARRGSG